MWLVVGLGNPGKRYAANRHNAGFVVLDELVRRHQLPDYTGKFGGHFTSGRVGGAGSIGNIGNNKALLLKPMEFMNLSGYALTRAANFYDLEASEIIVVHDEADLPMGRVKLKAGGGHGGHNGLRSICKQFGSRDFARVRLGVDKPRKEDGDSPGDGRVASYLLSDFPAAQRAELDAMVRRAADAVEAIISVGIRDAMNEFNGADPTPSSV